MKTITDIQRQIMDQYEENLIYLLNLPEKEHLRILNEDLKFGKPNIAEKYNVQVKRNKLILQLKEIQKWKNNF